MTQSISLEQIPNQNFQLVLEQDSYDITIRSIYGLSYVSISRNNELLISNFKAMPNTNILPYTYTFKNHGNFRFFSSLNENYPNYLEYGVSTFFQYVTKEEVVNGL